MVAQIKNNSSALYYFYLFFVLAVVFLMPFGVVILTVNEELFVFLSFLLFVDLFGRTLMNAVAGTADQKIDLLAARQSGVLTLRATALLTYRNALVAALRPLRFRAALRRAMVGDLLTLTRARRAEVCGLLVHNRFFAYKFLVAQELALVKQVFAAAVSGILGELQARMLLQRATLGVSVNQKSLQAGVDSLDLQDLQQAVQASTSFFSDLGEAVLRDAS